MALTLNSQTESVLAMENDGTEKVCRVTLSMKPEMDLDPGEKEGISSVLQEAFPDVEFEGRIFYKQLPTLRFLAKVKGQVIGQVGVDHRTIMINGTPTPILGVVDLCVKQAFCGKGIGSALLEKIHALAEEKHIPHVVAFADDQRIYKALGYAPVDAVCRFLAVEVDPGVLRSHSVIEREEPSLMMKSFVETQWEDRPQIDFLGHIF